MIHITSIQNPLVKQVLQLQKKSAVRKQNGLFVAEGRREVSLALTRNYEPLHVLLCEDLFENDPDYPVGTDQSETHPITRVSRVVYNKLAYRKDAEGVMMIGKQHMHGLQELTMPENPLMLVLEGLEKPGNLGAIIRTADAAGVTAIILADCKTDLYNPNAIRASLGCVFTVPVAICSSGEVICWLNDHKIRGAEKPEVFLASLQTNMSYFEANMEGPTVLVFGAEDKGLSDVWKTKTFQSIRIPMAGSIDSLNVSASVAILCFEAVRQRSLAGKS